MREKSQILRWISRSARNQIIADFFICGAVVAFW
jgi:hypothetical protein